MNVPEKILSEIKKLKRNQNSTNQDYVTGYMSALSTVEGIIAEMHEGWIPVEEKLPDNEEENVLVVVNGKYEMAEFEDAIMLGNYSRRDKDWCVEGWEEWENPNVAAWQPLPEPYKPHEHGNHTSAMEEHERFFTEGEPIYERT